MTSDAFFAQVETHFRYLVDEHGFEVVERTLGESFDHARLVLRSAQCCVRVTREKGYVEIGAGPASGEIFYGLATLVAYVTQEEEELPEGLPDDRKNLDDEARVEWQVERLAAAFLGYRARIGELFGGGGSDERRASLRDFSRARFERWVARLMGSPDETVPR